MLRDIRKSIGWTQVQLSAALELDPTYLSQLENGRKPLDDSYLRKARDIKANIENAKKVKGVYGEGGAPPGVAMKDEPGFQTQLRVKCHRHIDQYLDGCDREQMAWALVELKRRFPVDSNSPRTDEIPEQIARDILEPDSNGSGAAERNAPPSQKKLGQ